MSKPIPMYRNILLSENVESSSVKNIINSIMAINHDDDEKETEYKDWVREPIKLFINSFGGSVYDGLAVVDVIKNSKTPVYTISIGSSMSMGLWMFMAGHKRLIGENATLMFHDISCGIHDKTEGWKQEIKEMERLQKILIDEIVSKTLVKKEKLEDYINRKAEWYIPACEAIDLKFATEYYKG